MAGVEGAVKVVLPASRACCRWGGSSCSGGKCSGMEVIGGVRTDGWRDESDSVTGDGLSPVGVEGVGDVPSGCC